MKDERIESYQRSSITKIVFFRIIDNLRQACETLKIDHLVANMLIENMHEIAYLIYDES